MRLRAVGSLTGRIIKWKSRTILIIRANKFLADVHGRMLVARPPRLLGVGRFARSTLYALRLLAMPPRGHYSERTLHEPSRRGRHPQETGETILRERPLRSQQSLPASGCATAKPRGGP
jgi:hypothetical protein